MALRSGVPVADVEFFQFHPTALHHPAVPRPLLSEALRGHGALLRDAGGERFVDELAPRDVVSRAMAERMAAAGVTHLWLDATGLDAFAERFPTLAERLSAAGLDPSVDWLPIAPAAHYLSGGVITDLDGASALPGLWAAGETACTGVHGANRLASNSLLEGMVFGARLAEAIEEGRDAPVGSGVMRALLGATGTEIGCTAVEGLPAPSWTTRHARAARDGDVTKARARLQRAMTEGAGVLRSTESLAAAAEEVGDVAATAAACPSGRVAGEVANLAVVAWALLRAADARVETRGAHARVEHPETRPEWRRRLVHGHLSEAER
jgi:L-aspartate oxidase